MSKMIVYNINKKWILDKQNSFIDAMHSNERDSYLVSLYNYMFRKCSSNQIKQKLALVISAIVILEMHINMKLDTNI